MKFYKMKCTNGLVGFFGWECQKLTLAFLFQNDGLLEAPETPQWIEKTGEEQTWNLGSSENLGSKN